MTEIKDCKYLKLMLAKLLFVFVFFSYAGCQSSINTNKESKLDGICMPIIENFFSKIEANKYKVALDDLLLSNDNIDQKDSSTILMKKRFSEINQYSGPYKGNSLIRKKNMNDAISVYSYLAKYEKKYYRFVFVFYNNGINTKIYKFKFDDNPDVEMEESIKLYQ